MATTTTISSTYAGSDAQVYISAAIKSATTVANDVLTVLPNINGKTSLHTLTVTPSFVDYACDFTDAGTISLVDKYLDPKRIMMNAELCKNDFLATWEAERMGFGPDKNLPATFEEYLIGKIVEKTAAHIEDKIWQGNATASGEFDGLLLVLKPTGSGTVQVSGTTVTSTNAVAEIAKVYSAIPDAVINSDDVKFVVSNNVAKAYKQALAASGYGTLYQAANVPLDYLGIPMIALNGMPANTMLVFRKSNLFLGTDLLANANEVKVLDMANLDASDNVRIKVSFNIGVQYGVGSDIVIYYVA